ncbi:MAG: fumarylacetoacetate hydrolase family protein [Chloroflexi bacterium]|nr:fumarylacetoacetate hydrolase family protein [Chloroflexota bacterium]
MKLVFFNDFTLGVLKGNMVHDVSAAVEEVPHVTPQDLIQGVIYHFGTLRSKIEAAAAKTRGIPRSQVHLRSPLPRPSLMVNMAANYREFGVRPPQPINAFLKSPESVIGDGDTLVLPPDKAAIFHHEAELAGVIGKPARNVSAADAYDYIFGYVNYVDGSARGLGGGSFYWGKSWDTFCPMGPCLVTADEIKDPQNLHVQMWCNGDPRHDYNTSDMGHSIRRCVEYATHITLLEPGDIIAFGTNHQGIGAIQDGDIVEMEIEGLDRLTFRVQDDLHREWPRGIDHEMADRVAGRTPPPAAAPRR